MSAPKTNVKEEEKKHRVPLIGMGWTVFWSVGLLIALVVFLALRGNEPADGQSVDAEAAEQPDQSSSAEASSDSAAEDAPSAEPSATGGQ